MTSTVREKQVKSEKLYCKEEDEDGNFLLLIDFEERWSAERRVGASFAKSLKLTRDSATRRQTAAAAAAE